MADTAGRLSLLPRRGRTVNPVSLTSVDGSRGGGPGSPASPSCHGPSDSAEASVYGSGTSCHVLPWLLSLLISRTRIPRLSGFTASVILSLDVTICELRADASVKTRGNNHTRSSPGGTGHTVNDKMPLGTNLERARVDRKWHHFLFLPPLPQTRFRLSDALGASVGTSVVFTRTNTHTHVETEPAS